MDDWVFIGSYETVGKKGCVLPKIGIMNMTRDTSSFMEPNKQHINSDKGLGA